MIESGKLSVANFVGSTRLPISNEGLANFIGYLGPSFDQLSNRKVRLELTWISGLTKGHGSLTGQLPELPNDRRGGQHNSCLLTRKLVIC